MKSYRKVLLGLAAALLATSGAHAVTFESVNGNVVTDTRWTRDKVYILTRVIFVTNGANLTIEPGTIIRGVSAGVDGSDLINEPGTLVVARDSKLIANGTADDPIILTSIDDPNVPGGAATIPGSYVNSQGGTKTNGVEYGFSDYSPDGDGPLLPGGADGDNGFAFNGRWGGVVILGNGLVGQGTDGLPGGGPADSGTVGVGATRNDPANIGQDYVEGLEPGSIPDVGPDDPGAGDSNGIEFLGVYGGVDDDDNSGVYRFVSIRYSGFEVGAANEINSFTAGGLGKNTVIEFVESTFNQDDGFEFFGGINDTRFLFALYIKDDSFDGDEGFRGNHQFWCAVQGSTSATRQGFSGIGNGLEVGQEGSNAFDHVFEIDGSEPSNAGGLPQTQWNVYNMTALAEGADEGLRLRDGANGNIRNSVVNFTTNANEPFELDSDVGTVNAENIHYTGGSGKNNGTGTLNEPGQGVSSEGVEQVRGTGIYTKNGLDPRLDTAGGVASATSDGPAPPAGLVNVNYAGFQRENTFLNGWSHLQGLDILPATNRARPAVKVGVSGTNPTVSFDSAGAGVIYSIEKSTDRRTWVPVTTVSGAGTLSHTDTTTTLAAGTPVYYRAYGL